MGGVVINIPKLGIYFVEGGFSTSREGRYQCSYSLTGAYNVRYLTLTHDEAKFFIRWLPRLHPEYANWDGVRVDQIFPQSPFWQSREMEINLRLQELLVPRATPKRKRLALRTESSKRGRVLKKAQ
jgi:hypothetical protein